MPEYLAPGVYVEETSFRAKSIEGVSTSTTAFAGLTRKGPIYVPELAEDTPELLTSFGDFERIYGGFADVGGRPNYLAHAVHAYFNNGGARLFVSRVYQAPNEDETGVARSADLLDGGAEARFVARSPGEAGNGAVVVREVATPATVRTLAGAPLGSLLRLGGRRPSRPARVEGNPAPFALPDGGTIVLTVGGAAVSVTVHGAPAVATGAALADPVALEEDDRRLTVVVDGVPQTINLPGADTPPATIVALINQQLRRGTASLAGGKLAITSDRRGTAASVSVPPNAGLGFAAGTTVTGADDAAANNVADLTAIGADDLDRLLSASGVRASVSPTTGNLVLSSADTGAAATIAVGAGTANAALGLRTTTRPAAGVSGASLDYFVKTATGWQGTGGAPLDTSAWGAAGAPADGADLITVSVVATEEGGDPSGFDGLGLDARHPRYVGHVLAEEPTRRAEALQNAFALRLAGDVSALDLRHALFPAGDTNLITLRGGSDGSVPTPFAYETAIAAFEKVEDISIVAAPDGASFEGEDDLAQGVHNALIAHAERRRAYRIAVLDTPPFLMATEAMEVRGRIDSTRAALYYPWVVIPNPLARPGDSSIPQEIAVPPSGFVCGIYARSDVQRGVIKAPANEVVLGALRFETDVNFAQQELLNPAGVNCLRFFPGRGYRVWGARTASSDPEWKYVNIRRYFNYLEHSIDRSTQWAVFEPNGERLWANIRETIASFLYNEWVSGALLGESPKEAFFVKCDRSTMTQYNLDNGQLICLIGVAAIKPAEFVIFRIGQKTADART